MRAYRTILTTTLLAGLALAGGCAGGAAEESFRPAHEAQGLAQLPDCSAIDVAASYRAEPSAAEGIYVVREGTVSVCATDFAGLEQLALRSDSIPAIGKPTLSPAASNPMPGHGTDPAASNPMPGRGTDPAASNPMPGRDPATLRALSTLSR